jgi:hypothetical protein
MASKTKTGKANATYQIYARMVGADAAIMVGPPTTAPAWKAIAMTSVIRDRADVANAWYKTVKAAA